MSRLLHAYNRLLETHPYKTQSVTAAVLWCCGDLLSQVIEAKTADAAHVSVIVSPPANSNSGAGSGVAHCDGGALVPPPPPHPPVLIAAGGIASGEASPLQRRLELEHEGDVARHAGMKVDWKRLGIMTSFGLCIAGPLYTWWYARLDHVVTGYFARKQAVSAIPMSPTRMAVQVTGTKLFADLFIFDPPYLSLFFSSTSLASGMPVRDMVAKYKRDALPTYLVDISVWGPIQAVNFTKVKVVYQPLVVNSVNIFWNAYLSYVGHSS
ncbi:hypothetical protein H9P43_007697 [Blastocladiella emersonii ATCC 22665]|nr:hypothetical protein H9P43_007697 [Blastocladiella emersonii ATCC 22665]